MSMIASRPARFLTVLCTGLLLAACQSLPAPGKWSAAQRDVLQSNGFVASGDDWSLTLGERLLFASDQSQLLPDQEQGLEKLAQRLKSVGITTARIDGHTDSTGSTDYNQALSKARAQAVAAPMQRGGMALDGSKIIGHGEKIPLSSNETEDGRRDNRRVVILITPGDAGQ